ncbi:MAG: restriction endonuclease subunit S [Bacteroidales bacterium]|nr:restriction endonuclease subunit S [Bacteroidales bacterium]
MESIEQMIKKLCPKGVEYVKLGEVCNVLRGKRLTKKELFDDAQYKVFHGGLSPIGYYTKSNRQAQTVMVINVGASAGTVGFCEEDFWSSDGCFCLDHNDSVILPKYLYYYLAKHQISIQSRVRKAGIPTLDAGAVMDILIPLAPLEIQSRIVEVLDKMTTLTAELEAELEARKQQYEYYRNQLLTRFAPNQPVTEYSLGELFVFKNGLNASKEQFGHGTPIVNYVNVYKKCSIVSDDLQGRVELDNKSIERYRVQRGDVFFTRTSETQDEIGIASVLLEDIEDCVFSGFVLRARPFTNILLPEYCKYCFSTNIVRRQIIRLSTMTTRALTNGTSLSEVKILVPSMQEQQRIVSILDRFETLTTDLQSGLPAEIEARRQQYEYYRNKLLTFEAV